MTRLAARFDLWVQRGPFTPLDLGVYRIVYALCVVITVPDITWLSEFPDSAVRTPSGPFRLLTELPPNSVLIGLEVARATALILLGLGLHTRLMSLLVAILLVITFGLSYSLGHVHHTILLVLTPLVLAFANWGERLSIDAVRHRKPAEQQQQWPMRLLAFAVGLALFSAALPKILSGWLSPATQATQEYFYGYYYFQDGSRCWLGHMATQLHIAAIWESVDWFTVILELSVLLTVPWWRAFRIALAVATLFHLSVFLMLGISFTPNVITYGAFVSWGLAVSSSRLRAMVDVLRRPRAAALSAAMFVAVGVIATILLIAKINSAPVMETVIVFIGVAFGACYLIVSFVELVRHYRPEGVCEH